LHQHTDRTTTPAPKACATTSNSRLRQNRIFQYAMMGAFLFLLTGFWTCNPQSRNDQERALQKQHKSIPVLAPRGKILDPRRRVVRRQPFVVSFSSPRKLEMEHLNPSRTD